MNISEPQLMVPNDEHSISGTFPLKFYQKIYPVMGLATIRIPIRIEGKKI